MSVESVASGSPGEEPINPGEQSGPAAAHAFDGMASHGDVEAEADVLKVLKVLHPAADFGKATH